MMYIAYTFFLHISTYLCPPPPPVMFPLFTFEHMMYRRLRNKTPKQCIFAEYHGRISEATSLALSAYLS